MEVLLRLPLKVSEQHFFCISPTIYVATLIAHLMPHNSFFLWQGSSTTFNMPHYIVVLMGNVIDASCILVLKDYYFLRQSGQPITMTSL